MNVLIAPIGTFGDVAPVITHAHELRKRGDNIHFVITSDFVEYVKSEGFSYTEIPFNFTEFTNQNMSVIGKPFKAMFHFKKDLNKLVNISFDTLKGIIKEYEYIIGSGLQFAAYNLAESTKTPYQHFVHAPVWLPSVYHSPPFIKKQFIGHTANKILWKLFIILINRILRKNLNKRRASLGLLPLKNVYRDIQNNITLSCNSDLIQAPHDTVYNNQIPYLFALHEKKLPEKLCSFLSTPKKVIYVGFGSMPLQNSNALLSTLEEVCKSIDVKIIFQVNKQAEIRQTNSTNIYILNEKVSHEELFKQVNLVIHHGGAGTVHQAFRTQTPQLIIPCMLDQFYWASVVSKRNIGIGPLFLNKLNCKSLSEYILSGLKINIST